MRLRRMLLVGSIASLTAISAAFAAELEPGAILEGFPFSGAASVAFSADGRQVFAAGNTSPRVGTKPPG